MRLWSSSSLNFVRCIRNRRRFKEIQTADFTHNWMQRQGRFNSNSARYRKFHSEFPLRRASSLRVSGHLASFVRLAAVAFRKLSRGWREGGGDALEFTWRRCTVPILLRSSSSDDVLAAPVPRIRERFSASLLQIQRFPGFFHLSAVNCPSTIQKPET